LESLKDNLKYSTEYIKTFIKWIVISSFLGLVGGSLGSLFHIAIEKVTHIRENNTYLIFLLPLGAVLITMIYRFFRAKGHIDTNRILEAARDGKKVPLIMVPLIFISTIITHLLGGSAGREGAALQLGGSLGYNIGKLLRLNDKDINIIVLAGMSSVFSALFGTPLTAAIFSMEVVNVGVLSYWGMLPCIISAIVAYSVSLLFGLTPVKFSFVTTEALSINVFFKIIILSLVIAIASIAFIKSIEYTKFYLKKLVKNPYLRAFSGGLLLLILTLLVGTYDYNGAGMNVVERAMMGESNTFAFLLKIIFTAITIASGFKGGEIVPSFFIGSTLGCVMGGLLGIDAGFAAAIGFVAFFCGVVNCPIASIILSVEVFGAEGLLLFSLAVGVSYLMSGRYGLYKSQRIVYSKLDNSIIDE